MENNNFLENSEKRIQRCFQDYANNFNAFEPFLDIDGNEGLQQLIKSGYKIPTVKDYLKKYRSGGRMNVNTEDEKNPIFIEKAKILDELANKINSLGDNLNKQTIVGVIEEVKKIIYN